MARDLPPLIAVALNPALDRSIEVPGLEIGGHVRGRLVSVQPAGKAVNMARLLGTLGTPCILTGFIGESDRERFAASFEKSLVRVEMFEARGTTRENITLIDPEAGVETHVRDTGFPLAPDDLGRLAKKLGILASEGAVVVFAGSLPPEMGASDFQTLVEVCRAAGARVAVDSSGEGLQAVRSGGPLWLVKPNREELAELTGQPVGSDEELREAAAQLARYVELVVVTAGADGAWLFAPAGVWRARPDNDPETVVNTVGCGDALLAGFVRAYAAGRPPDECLRRGVACGTAATLKVRAGEVDPARVEAAYEAVTVSRVDGPRPGPGAGFLAP